MKKLIIIVLTLFSLCTAQAQKRNNDNTQREIEYQLANQKYKEQEYAEAGKIFLNLYKKYNQQHYLNQYVECMIHTGEYDKAEKALKDYTKKNNTAWKPLADLVYVYTIDGKKNEADKVINNFIKDLPPNKYAIVSMTSSLRARSLYDQSIKILEKASELHIDNDNYYTELAIAYQNTGDYERCFDYYLRYAKFAPSQYDNVQNNIQAIVLNDTRGEVSELLRRTLLKRLQKNANDNASAKLLIWLSLQQQDYELALDQSISLDRRMNNYDNWIINLANITSNNRQYDIAKRGYQYIINKKENNIFRNEALIGLLNTEYQELEAKHGKQSDYNRLADEIQDALNTLPSNTHTQLISILASIKAYHTGNPEEAETLLQNTLDKYLLSRNDIATLKMSLADIKLAQNDIWEATLLYSQTDKSMKEEPLGHEARFKNAQLRYFIGEFAWAETQLKILKAATSKLIANDAMSLSMVIKDNLEADTTGAELRRVARADYDIYRHDYKAALLLLDSIIATGNNISIPHAMYKKAELLEKDGDTQQAEKLYNEIHTLYPGSYIADDALMKSASIATQNKNIETAKSLYETIIDEYPTSIYTTEAKRLYRNLQKQ